MKNIGNEYFVTKVEIDTEIVDMLYKGAFGHKKADGTEDVLVWSKKLPVGVSKFEHYQMVA